MLPTICVAGTAGWVAACVRFRGQVCRWRGRLAEANRAARRDRLTGLDNRAGLEAAWRQLRRDGRADVVVLLADVDGLKPVNDTLGHAAGDQLIQAVAARLGEFAAPAGCAARLGGDEFVVVVPAGVLAGGPAEVAEQLRRRVCARPVAIDARLLELRLSVGATLASTRTDLYEVLPAADAAMYQAKTSGSGTHVADLTAADTAAQPDDRRRDAAHARRLAAVPAAPPLTSGEAS